MNAYNIPPAIEWFSDLPNGDLRLHNPLDPDLKPIDPDQPPENLLDSRLTDGMDYLRAMGSTVTLGLLVTKNQLYRTDLGAEPGILEDLMANDGVQAVGHTMPGSSHAHERALNKYAFAASAPANYENGYHQRLHEAASSSMVLPFYAGVESGPHAVIGSSERAIQALRSVADVQQMDPEDQGGQHHLLDIAVRNMEQWYTVATLGQRLMELHEIQMTAGYDIDASGLVLAVPFKDFDVFRKAAKSGIPEGQLLPFAASDPDNDDFAAMLEQRGEYDEVMTMQTGVFSLQGL